MSFALHGITHVALECSSPTRMERYLRDAFGMQLLRVGYWKGEYVRVVGSPHYQRANPGFVHLYNRPFIARGRLRYVAVGVRDRDVDSVVGELRARGLYDIDGEDVIAAPEGLRIKLDSFTHPRRQPTGDPVTKMVDVQIDPTLPCMVQGIHHIAVEVGVPACLRDWLVSTFGLVATNGDRRGEIVTPIFREGIPDPVGRSPALMALFLRREQPASSLNHIAFDMPDADAAIGVLESRGVKVDLPGDAMIHGPEEVWYQIDSRDAPFPMGHPANDPEVVLDSSPHVLRARQRGGTWLGSAGALKGS